MDIDLDKFKAEKPWRQLGFWASLAPLLLFVLPTDARDFLVGHWKPFLAAATPFTAWLMANGLVRSSSVKAAGVAAAAIGPEVARHETLYGARSADS